MEKKIINNEKNKTTGGNSFFKFLFKSRYVMLSFVIGLLIGIGVMQANIPTQIATLSDDSTSIALWGEKDAEGNYTEGLSANELYDSLKSKVNISTVLDLIDAKLLEEDYPYEEYKVKATTSAEEYIASYGEYYGLSETDFLNYYGFPSKEDFIEYLTLDTQRYDYYSEKIISGITEKEKKSFYKNDVYGDIAVKYVGITVNDESEVDETLIKEILKKVKKGATYDDIVSEYGEKEGFSSNSLTVSYDGGYEEKFVNAVRKLKDNSHSTNYVKTETFGYTIIFRETSAEKPEYSDVEELIPEIMLNQMTTEDATLFPRTFIQLRKEKGVTFTDDAFAKAYKQFVKDNK